MVNNVSSFKCVSFPQTQNIFKQNIHADKMSIKPNIHKKNNSNTVIQSHSLMILVNYLLYLLPVTLRYNNC